MSHILAQKQCILQLWLLIYYRTLIGNSVLEVETNGQHGHVVLEMATNIREAKKNYEEWEKQCMNVAENAFREKSKKTTGLMVLLKPQQTTIMINLFASSSSVDMVADHAVLTTLQKALRTRMWVDAQRDGHPAKYRLHPLFNAAKFG